MGAVIDSDYQGTISVILTNFGSGDVNINRWDKIAQITFVKPVPVPVRGAFGFGSTGR